MIKVSNSRVKTWRRCPNAHYYKYVEKLEPKKKKAALMKGSMIHDMIEAWVNGDDWRRALREYEKQYDKLFLEEKEEYGDIINDMMVVMHGYVAFWEKNELEYIEQEGVRTEHPLEVELIPGRVLFTGVIDRIGRDKKDRVWLVESKSFKKNLPKEEIRVSDLQTTLYYWGAPKCGFPEPHGVMWDYIRSKPPAIPELLKKGGLSKRKNIDTTYETYLAAIKHHGLEVSDYAEILENLKTKPNGYYRRTYRPAPKKLVNILLNDLKSTALEIEALGETLRTRHLSHDCGWWCNYYSLCQAELQGLDTDFLRKKEYQERSDPNESQEDKEEQS